MQAGTFQILVGIDFSDHSASAMYHAVTLAERVGAILHLAHITPTAGSLSAPVDLGLNIPPELPDAREARRRLERMRAMMAPALQVALHLRIGDPVSGMLDLARELKPDVMVVGSHGYGAVMQALMGSVSNRLIHESPVPVLVIPAPGRELAAKLEAGAAGDASSGATGEAPNSTSQPAAR